MRSNVSILSVPRKADFTLKDFGGFTALKWAEFYGHPEAAAVLRSAGATEGYEASSDYDSSS